MEGHNSRKAKKREELKAFINEHRAAAEIRSNYHFIPPTGWMNDPNGFSEYKGEYHLFYQYYPFEPIWGTMHWGHAVTRDLLCWRDMEIALLPGDDCDKDGVYSGTALQEEGRHILMYTGHICEEGQNDYHQVQNIAAGDGKEYKKFEGNPVITGDMLPDGCSRKDFRDPKIFKENGRYFALLANASLKGGGRLVLFASDNLKNWSCKGVLRNDFSGPVCKMWECPDYVKINDRDVMIFSFAEAEAEGYRYANGYGAVYEIGEFQKEEAVFFTEYGDELDCGLDFYAPQTLAGTDGRVIMIAWMQVWKRNIPLAEKGIAGMMTLPRELTVRDGRLYQTPVREIRSMRKNEISHEFVLKEKRQVQCFKRKSFELFLCARIRENTVFTLYVTASDDCEKYCAITYDAKSELLGFDRSKSGSKIAGRNERQVRVPLKDGFLELDLFLDQYSVEIFCQKGACVLSNTVYNEENSLFFEASRETELKIKLWEL